MTNQQLIDWRSEIEVDIEHLRAFIALPNSYFSPKGAQHWYQVVSRSEIEARLASHMRMVDHINCLLLRQPGARVRLTADVAPYPLDNFPKGTTGIVVETYPDALIGNPVGFIKLDQHFDCLNEWDNVLQVFRPEDGEVTWSLFGQEG